MSSVEITRSEPVPPAGYSLVRRLVEAGGRFNCGIYLFKALCSDEHIICKQTESGDSYTEAHIARQVRDFPHVVPIVDFIPANKFQEKHSLYFRYCNQGTLENLRLRHHNLPGSFPESFLWHVLLSIAKALEACHTGLGRADWVPIAHRDIHRGNILLSKSQDPTARYPEVFLADFGLAKYGGTQKELQGDIASLGFTVYDLSSVYDRHEEEVWNDLKERVENGEWVYSDELALVLGILMDYWWNGDDDIVRRPIEKLVPWIVEMWERADLRYDHGELMVE
ncbi:hypothetical protein DM02DRAFT_652709 [Periconia macrospinosa]|uniref:non-specific serine/threonine protein kinase n=1 Tax=Periconia macrospinosa TaxID=97972 RepID=A0A2V1DYW6_9PLEO|nr:hypothetical protein DM02DRAFT_652709 [Periconia macrospinosa]